LLLPQRLPCFLPLSVGYFLRRTNLTIGAKLSLTKTEKKNQMSSYFFFRHGYLLLFLLSIFPRLSLSDPRATEAALICQNRTAGPAIRQTFISNFLAALDVMNPLIAGQGYAAVVNGTGNATVYAFGECMKDLDDTDCNVCFAQCKTQILRCLPFQRAVRGGRLFYDGCYLRYDDYNFFNESSSVQDRAVCAPGNFSGGDLGVFGANAISLVRNLSEQVVGNDGFSVGSVSRGNVSVFGLVQCWEFVNGSNCRSCLADAVEMIGNCTPREEGRVLKAGCYMRYSTRRFYNISSSSPNSGNEGGSKHLAVILASVFSAVAAVLIITAAVLVARKRIRERRTQRKELGAMLQTVNKSRLNYSYESLEKATNYFNQSNKLGQGGSGSVYKGVLADGKTVAIKRLFFNTRQWVDHFFNEVNLISGIHHKNLVKLLGCSITGPESLLVYEYVPNLSLYDYIGGSFSFSHSFVTRLCVVVTRNAFVYVSMGSDARLTWEMRFNIVLGTAEGLAFLHEESELRIIHRDIKLSNILLDADYSARIADFGLARMFPEDQTHISTAVAGTLGYMAPEYVVRGKLTEKADVYSFGVVVIELVTGRKNNSFSRNQHSILQTVWNLYGTGHLYEAVDPSLQGDFRQDEATRLLQIGLLCVQASADLRPAMSLVVKMVVGDHEIVQPTQPPFLNQQHRTAAGEASSLTLQKTMITITAVFLLLLRSVTGDARAQTVNVTCDTEREANPAIFVPNFVATMENISDQMRISGFGAAQAGEPGPNRNFGLAQCYGDLSLLDCVLCYAEARTILPQCYPFNGGRIFLDGCFMRAENYSFFDQYSGAQDRAVCGNETGIETASFRDSVRQGLEEATGNAVANGGYSRAEVAVSGTNSSVFVLANCWRSLNSSSCRLCLENASSSVVGCLPRREGRALNTGCFMRYSDRNFLNNVARNRSSRVPVSVIVVSVVSCVLVLVVGAAIGGYIWKHRYIEKKRRGSNDVHKLVKTLNDSSLNFKYSTLEKATGSFDEANKLGQGGFGSVYKVTSSTSKPNISGLTGNLTKSFLQGVLADGREIAVKRLFFNNKHRVADFFNEVNMISTVEHKNLVRLLGCSCSGPESLLVYEFLHNRSLDSYIFDVNKGKTMTWDRRYEVIVGTAEGLVYLHENSTIRIIHRDIKASNILLDSRLRAKIADFGLARSFQEDKSHISTAIAGTLGYMAPEYLAHGQLTEKADVYSFGVLLLEIVTGRQNNRSKSSEYTDSLVTLMWRQFQAGSVEELYDPNLMLQNHHNSNVKNDVLRVVHVALLCTQESPSIRPLMSKVLQMLTTEELLPPPMNPPFIDEKTMGMGDQGCEDPCFPLNIGNSESVATVDHSSFQAR
ncbi:Cysteine-rich receptor-like protein kinase 2, partial [Linum perenne]